MKKHKARQRFARACRDVTRAARPSASHLALLFLALLALTIQTLVVQAHFHPLRIRSWEQSASAALSDNKGGASSSTATKPDKNPLTEDPTNCPLCQEMAQGQFIHNAAPVALSPFVFTLRFIVLDAALPDSFTASHSWQGRAPPQL
jgi:hypothetical protein